MSKTYNVAVLVGSLRKASINRKLALNNDRLLFASLFIGLLDTGNGSFRFANAGHMRPVIARQGEPARLPRAADPGPVHQPVVFDEAQEHAAQQPVHAGLGDDLVDPGLEGLGAAVGIACGLFIASLHSMGLATLTHTPNPMGFLTEILGRPATERPYILFPVGYPAPGCEVPALERKPLGEALMLR